MYDIVTHQQMCKKKTNVRNMSIPGPWQRNFIDARFPQFHMFSTVWSCTTTIGLPEFYIRVRLKVTFYSDVIQEAQSNDLLHTVRLLMRLDTPLHGNNARGAKYTVYYASVATHTVFENIKWLRLELYRIRNVAVPSLACLFPVNTIQILCIRHFANVTVKGKHWGFWQT